MKSIQGRVAVASVVVAAMALSACGSGTGSAKSSSTTTPSATTQANAPKDTSSGKGVTKDSIKVGIALVDFKTIAANTDLVRSTTDQKNIYQLYIDNINKNGGINGRKIVPVYKFYSPIGSAGILSLCTSFVQDDNVFAVMGTFVDFSGDAQTCVANQGKRVLMTFYITQGMIDKSPAGLIVTPSEIPERSASILIQLLQKEKTLNGKKIVVMGDNTRASIVNDSIVPALKKAGMTLGDTALLNVGTGGDFTAALAQLDSFIEKWKSEHVGAVLLSGDLASNKPFVEKLKQSMPDLVLLADTTDVLSQAQQVQQSGVKPNPYEGILTAGGLTAAESDAGPNWKYCADLYKKATGKDAPDAEHTLKLPNGKINDVHGAIDDACQLVSMFHDIAVKAGPYLNNANWINAVDNYGPITNRGSGPYSSLHTGKYTADDTWRLQKYDSSLGDTGLWAPVTPVANISGN